MYRRRISLLGLLTLVLVALLIVHAGECAGSSGRSNPAGAATQQKRSQTPPSASANSKSTPTQASSKSKSVPPSFSQQAPPKTSEQDSREKATPTAEQPAQAIQNAPPQQTHTQQMSSFSVIVFASESPAHVGNCLSGLLDDAKQYSGTSSANSFVEVIVVESGVLGTYACA